MIRYAHGAASSGAVAVAARPVEPAEPGSVVAWQGSSEYPTVYVRQGDGLSDGRHWLCGQQWVSWEMILANRGPECVYLLAPKYR